MYTSNYFLSWRRGNIELPTSFVGYTPVFVGVAAMTNDGHSCFYHMEDN